MEETKKKKVALYIRVSTEEQVEMYGVGLQKSALMGLIASKIRDCEFAGDNYVYIDEGISGTTPPDERPAFRRLMEDISNSPARPFDAVAVYKIDRFARRLKILLEILDLFNQQERPIEFISANENIDTSTPFGRAMLGIIGVIAELEMETIRERTMAGKRVSAESGNYMGTPPLGYIKDTSGKIIKQEEEVKIVVLIFHMFVYDGRSTEYIAKYLKTHKILTPQAFRLEHQKEEKPRKMSVNGPYNWSSQAVKTVLVNELYLGRQYYNKTKNGKPIPKEQWGLYLNDQDIVDIHVFNQAQDYLRTRRNKHYRELPNNKKYLLQGLLKCANCYNPLLSPEPYSWHGIPHIVKSTGEKAYYYTCSSKDIRKKQFRSVECNTIPLPAEPLEKHVIELIKSLLDNPDIVFKYQQNLQSKKNDIKVKRDRLKIVKDLINKSSKAKENILQLFKDGYYDSKKRDTEILKEEESLKRLNRELKDLESELALYTNTKEYYQAFEAFRTEYAETINNYKEGIDQDQMYRLIHLIIDEIIVFSRPKRKTDSISGPKKEGQMIPYKLKVVLKIPAEMLHDLLYSLSPESKLQAEKDKWWMI